MKNNNHNTNSSGLGLSSVLTIIFTVLKLTGLIDWSWWWVISPTLISLGFCAIVILGIFLAAVIESDSTKKGGRNGWKF